MSNQPPKALKEDEVIHSELMEARRTMRNLVDEMIESAPDEEPATTCITHLTKDQKRRYYVQPDMLPYYIGSMNDDQETLEYVKGLSMRFWYNIQPANFRSHWHTALTTSCPCWEIPFISWLIKVPISTTRKLH